MIKAMLYLDYKIYSIDDLMAYLVDYIVFGQMYPLVGFTSTFTEINFFPTNIFCYQYNWYGSSNAGASTPTKNTGGVMETNTMFYGANNQASYPT